ncbi:uncharacterized protein LOC132601760 [Lycium barbarum]|uniref:uncharacterized protein LOC132601760 n=1 Tax=Lycium barbarum TaxID=112863 RepID=UPI00293E91A3|nr:uncharacterized protein LOC132601760 [Lycium barbarum]
MSNSHTHSSADYHGNHPHSQLVYRRSPRIPRGPYDHYFGRRHHSSVYHQLITRLLNDDEPYLSRDDQGTITDPQNYQSVPSPGIHTEYSIGTRINNVSGRDSMDSLLRTALAENLQGQSSQNWHNSPHYSQSTSELNDDIRMIELSRLMTENQSSPASLLNDEQYALRHRGTITPHNYQSEASNGINISILSDPDSVDSGLRSSVADNLQGLDDLEQYLTGFYDPIDLEVYMDDQKEKDEDVILNYFKTRTHHVVAPKDGLNNATLTEEVADKESADICAICQAEFEHEETIGTLQCGHEYHVDCINQWLLRKKDCPMCRASALPFTSTKTIETDSILGLVWE